MHIPIILPFFRILVVNFTKNICQVCVFFHPIHENRFALKKC